MYRPDSFQFAYDNGGVENGGTIDRYSINFMFDEGEEIESATAFTNECMSVFSEIYEHILSEDIEYKSEYYEDVRQAWGKQIEWEEIPKNLREELLLRYGIAED